MKFLLPIITGAGLLISGCGTQTGNAVITPDFFTDKSLLGSVLNFLFMDAVDSANTGDYSYSADEARFISERNCRRQGGAGLALIKETEAEHSVRLDTALFAADSDLKLRRSYEDRWYLEGLQVDCNPLTASPGFNLHTAQKISLISKLDDDKSRELRLNLKGDQTTVRHSASISKAGTRKLKFSRSGKILTAGLTQEVSAVLRTDDEEGNEKNIGFTSDRDQETTFRIHLTESGWSSYEMTDARFRYYLPDNSVLDLVFTDLVLQNDGDCLPDDGTVQGTLRRGDTEISWRLTDDNSGGLPAFQLNDDSRLAFAPFACVLNER